MRALMSRVAQPETTYKHTLGTIQIVVRTECSRKFHCGTCFLVCLYICEMDSWTIRMANVVILFRKYLQMFGYRLIIEHGSTLRLYKLTGFGI